MSTTHISQSPVLEHDPITVGACTTLDIVAAHGPDWFPLTIKTGELSTTMYTTLYLKRTQLHALRCRLDEIDDGIPAAEA